MSTSQAGQDFIKGYEELRLQSYDDGYGYWTIGWGHTKGVKPGQVIDEDRAEFLFQQDLVICEDAIETYVDVELEQYQYDALASFIFNCGVSAFAGSTLRKLLNSGDYTGAAMQFARWNKSAGKVSRGLVRRREAERRMFEGLS